MGRATGELCGAMAGIAVDDPTRAPVAPYYDVFRVHHSMSRDLFYKEVRLPGPLEKRTLNPKPPNPQPSTLNPAWLCAWSWSNGGLGQCWVRAALLQRAQLPARIGEEEPRIRSSLSLRGHGARGCSQLGWSTRAARRRIGLITHPPPPR